MPSSSDDESSNLGPASDAVVTFSDAAADTRSAARTAWRSVQHWVERRGRLTQFVVGGTVAMLLEALGERVAAVWSFASTSIPVLSEAQLLVALAIVTGGQTVMQRHKFNRVVDVLLSMNGSPDAAPDGGHELSRGEDEFSSSDTLWGFVLSWAAAGAVVGASYGVGGAVFGATVGAILADEVAKSDA